MKCRDTMEFIVLEMYCVSTPVVWIAAWILCTFPQLLFTEIDTCNFCTEYRGSMKLGHPPIRTLQLVTQNLQVSILTISVKRSCGSIGFHEIRSPSNHDTLVGHKTCVPSIPLALDPS